MNFDETKNWIWGSVGGGSGDEKSILDALVGPRRASE